MKIVTVILALLMISIQSLSAKDVILKNDNGEAVSSGYSNVWMMEETKLMMPDGPCTVKEIQIYFTGNVANKDTIYIVGDPAEGSVPPTFWCLSYNMKIPPIIFNYSGQPGWVKFPVTDLHLDGLDRLVVQHRVQPNGPWFAFDSDGLTPAPYTSFLMNPFENNSLGGPGKYYITGGDLMVRALIEYDLPDGNGSSLPPPPPVLFDVTKQAGILDTDGNFINTDDASVQDVNSDGWDDIVIGWRLFINQKDGTFKFDSVLKKFSSGKTSWADFNNDGNLDFYSLCNGQFDPALNMLISRDRIIKNLGNMTFQEMPPSGTFNLPYPSPGKDFNMSNQYEQDSIFNPYSCITALWTDYNGDGQLDLYLANNRVGFTANEQYNERYFPDQLWRQQNNNTFVNVTKTAGIFDAEPFSKPNNTWYGYYDCYGANACDYNNDSKPDIFVANYRLVKDNLYTNNGDGTMTDMAAQTGVQGEPTSVSYYFGHGMGAQWADYNNDGNMDLCVGNLGHPDWRALYSNPSLIYQNEGWPNFHFTDKHKTMGLKFFEMNAGVLWADLDLDGYQDLWHGQISYVSQSETDPMRPGLLYMNQGPPDYKLRDMTWFYGCALHGPWSAARIDFDHDGDLDLLILSAFNGARLFRNDLPKKGDWLAFRLIGNPSANVNLDAFGTKVFVYAAGKMFLRELNSISGTRMTQNTNELNFGLGNVAKATVDSVVVHYPNGEKYKIENVQKNKRYIIPYMADLQTNGLATPELLQPLNFSVKLNPTVQLSWKPVPDALSYDIEVYSDAGLTDKVFNENNSGNSITFNTAMQNHTFHWRVRTISATDTSAWTGLWNFTVGNLIPLAPVLQSPKDNSNDITLNPVLSWHQSEYAGYYKPKTMYNLQISDKLDFTADVLTYNDIDSLSILLPDTLKSSVKYYWRVRGNNNGAYGEWSDVWSFTSMTLPAAPTLILPENGATNVQNKPTLKWDKVQDASSYHLQVGNDENFTDIFYEAESLVLNQIRMLKNLTPSATYFWHVRCNKSGYSGDWSDTWSFTAEMPNSVDSKVLPDAAITVSPNPINGKASITLSCRKRIEGNIIIYDVLGRQIYNFARRIYPAGIYSYNFNSDIFDAGIYFVKLLSNDLIITASFVVQNK